MKKIFYILYILVFISCNSKPTNTKNAKQIFLTVEQAIRAEYVRNPESRNSGISMYFSSNYKAAFLSLSRDLQKNKTSLHMTKSHYKENLFDVISSLKESDKKYGIKIALNAFLSKLPIGESSFRYPNIKTLRQSFGIGAVIKKINSKFVVVDVFEGSGAFRANVQPGFELTSIQNQKIDNIDLTDLVSKIRGSRHSFIDIEFNNHPPSRIQRGEITFLPIQYSRWTLPNGQKVLYLMPRTTHKEVLNRIRTLLKGQTQILVLDLRKLFSGSIESSFLMADLFLGMGHSVRLKSRNSVIARYKSDPEHIFSKKIYVVYNRDSSPLANFLAYLLSKNQKTSLVGVSKKIAIYLHSKKMIATNSELSLVTGLVFSDIKIPLHSIILHPDISIESNFPKNSPLEAPDPRDLVQSYLSRKFKIPPN